MSREADLDTDEIVCELDSLEQDTALLLPDRLNEREEALHILAFIADLLEGEPAGDGSADRDGLRRRIAELRERIEAVTSGLVAEWRAWLHEDAPSPQAFRAACDRYTEYPPHTPGHLHLDYEPLDILLGGLFGLDRPVEEAVRREKGMVHLEFSPASVVLEMADRLTLDPDDLLVDLGAGLGHVAMLYHLLTGVPARGIEFQPTYVARARETAAGLGLRGVRFEQSDVRQADYGEGTAFYMFTPFHGQILRDVLGRLRAEAGRRPLRICTYGPCTLVVAREPWLRSLDVDAGHTSRLAIFAPR